MGTPVTEVNGSRLQSIWKLVEVNMEARGSQWELVEVHGENVEAIIVEVDGFRWKPLTFSEVHGSLWQLMAVTKDSSLR